MLNYIWLGLIVIAIAVALGRDVSELSQDRFRNGQTLAVEARPGDLKETSPGHYEGQVFVTKAQVAGHFGSDEAAKLSGDTVFIPATVVASPAGTVERGTLTLTMESAPPILKDLAQGAGDAEKMTGSVDFQKPALVVDSLTPPAATRLAFVPPAAQFRIMKKVANDGILKIADTAVELALGLIGVMTLWLGIMKIAEVSGLVGSLAKLVRPIMVRVFPDVPSDHPAIGAMVMNMTANFLGLSNAATPMGLKAMEELNKLNTTPGTATNAMVMFLTINTSAITLIPATVIAIRLSLGSHNPAETIMPTLLATVIALILGVMFTRFIQKFFPIKPDNQAPVAAPATEA
jgi:spore maturation protein SpmA